MAVAVGDFVAGYGFAFVVDGFGGDFVVAVAVAEAAVAVGKG